MTSPLPSPPAAPPSDRTTVRRRPERGRYDEATVHAIFDEAPICHLGFVDPTSLQPFTLPTIHARIDDLLYLHGSPASRMLRAVRDRPVCVTATLLDGLVLARSAFHHSMNYRSVVVVGTAVEVTDRAEKRHAMDALVDHVVAGRSAHARPPTDKELAATLVLRVPLAEASAKVRTGPPVDDEEDLSFPVWAGVVPLRTVAGEPVPAPELDAELATEVPDHVRLAGRRPPVRSAS